MELKDFQDLPDNVKNYIHALERSNTLLSVEVEQLQEKLKLAKFRKFGRSSEKIDPTQKKKG